LQALGAFMAKSTPESRLRPKGRRYYDANGNWLDASGNPVIDDDGFTNTVVPADSDAELRRLKEKRRLDRLRRGVIIKGIDVR
jgi:hypothetical protein